MKIIQIVPSIANESSGPSYSVPALCRGLVSAGCEVSLATLGPVPHRDFGFNVLGYKRSSFPFSSAGRSPSMLKGLVEVAQEVDVIHNSSLWMFPNVYGWKVKAHARVARPSTHASPKLVMQPRGTLSKWALSRHRLRKRFFGLFCGQYAALKATDMWVATAESEYEEIRALGYKQPICILPNGIDLPNIKVLHPAFKARNSKLRRMYFLSRIHPKKNVEMLIEVWAKLERNFPSWSLSVVGPDKNNPYADAMKALAAKLGCLRIVFEGELKGDEKYRFMADSDCMVLPTHSENFGMVVAESLACATPVVCSQGAPWAGLNGASSQNADIVSTLGRSGWWVPTTSEAFEMAMREAMSMSRAELNKLGENGRVWMTRDFSWESIGVKMKAAYAWLLDPEHVVKPEWVRLG